MQPRAQLVRVGHRRLAAAAREDDAGRGDAAEAGDAEELPGNAARHGRRSVRGVPTLTLDEAVATAATGDVWLFRGRSFADLAIRTLTNAPVNHVGMVVALDDLPPLLWHAELGRSLPDVWSGKLQRGVQLHLLRDAVTTWAERYGQRAWVRQLSPEVSREHEDRAVQVIDRYDGKPFPTTSGLARSWLRGRVQRTPVEREVIYCAELVAATYQHMGLLPDDKPIGWYDPGKFWSGDRIVLRPPFQLSGEVAVEG